MRKESAGLPAAPPPSSRQVKWLPALAKSTFPKTRKDAPASTSANVSVLARNRTGSGATGGSTRSRFAQRLYPFCLQIVTDGFGVRRSLGAGTIRLPTARPSFRHWGYQARRWDGAQRRGRQIQMRRGAAEVFARRLYRMFRRGFQRGTQRRCRSAEKHSAPDSPARGGRSHDLAGRLVSASGRPGSWSA